MWGPLVVWCLDHKNLCKLCLLVRRVYLKLAGKSSHIK
jgi:hypothetical protein